MDYNNNPNMREAPYLIYILEDNEWYNKLLVHHLSLNLDHVVKSFNTGNELLSNLNNKPDIITLDYRLPDMTGEDLLKKIKNYDPTIEVVIVSEQSDIETAIQLLKLGAYDYIVKSNDIRDRLLNTVSHIKNNIVLKNEIISLRKEVQNKYSFEKTVIGNSDVIKKVFSLMEKACETNITVLITGETGTGKEVVAKAIHYNSGRKDKPFVAVNMAAIPSELIESELFGYEKGAFTGAIARKKGKFEEAHGGTIFLDEIGEMDISLQAKLLRVLQEKEITRIGSNTPVKVDSRIIVATNKTLTDEVKKGNFREDLYYRLFGLPIHLPRLSERDKDVLLLSKYFIENFCKENTIAVKELSDNAKKKLLSYSWPGNIRELKSIIELAVVMSSNNLIEDEDISLSESDIIPGLMSNEVTLREYNRRIVNIYMKKYNNNTKIVATKLGIGQTTVYRLLKEESETE